MWHLVWHSLLIVSVLYPALRILAKKIGEEATDEVCLVLGVATLLITFIFIAL